MHWNGKLKRKKSTQRYIKRTSSSLSCMKQRRFMVKVGIVQHRNDRLSFFWTSTKLHWHQFSVNSFIYLDKAKAFLSYCDFNLFDWTEQDNMKQFKSFNDTHVKGFLSQIQCVWDWIICLWLQSSLLESLLTWFGIELFLRRKSLVTDFLQILMSFPTKTSHFSKLI